MNRKAGSFLQSYLSNQADDLVDLGAFVERGGRLVGEQISGSLQESLTGFGAKLGALQTTHPELAEQLRFLVDFAAEDERAPRTTRNEAIFALLYCASDADLIPDDVPEIGFSDDAAIAETVLARNAEFFASYGRARGVPVPALC